MKSEALNFIAGMYARVTESLLNISDSDEFLKSHLFFQYKAADYFEMADDESLSVDLVTASWQLSSGNYFLTDGHVLFDNLNHYEAMGLLMAYQLRGDYKDVMRVSTAREKSILLFSEL